MSVCETVYWLFYNYENNLYKIDLDLIDLDYGLRAYSLTDVFKGQEWVYSIYLSLFLYFICLALRLILLTKYN